MIDNDLINPIKFKLKSLYFYLKLLKITNKRLHRLFKDSNS